MTVKAKHSLLTKLVALLLLCLIACLTACGVYVDPNPPDDGGDDGDTDVDKSKMFTVDLVLNDRPFTPPVEMYAQWTGDDGIYRAKFDENGHAERAGLDGDYHVTLSVVPDGYTYDCNNYRADNNNRNVTVKMLAIVLATNRRDTGMYNCVKISKLGTYRAILQNANHKIFFEYQPISAGRYTVQSWVDIYENEVNPYMDVYGGTFANKFFLRTQDGGGASSTYTKNFLLEIELTKDEVGNVWSFQVYANCRSGEYPLVIDFTIALEQEIDGTREGTYENYYAHGPFYDASVHGSVANKPARYIYEDSNNVLNEKMVKLNPADGFYHVYDETKYASNNGYGPILFVYLSVDTRVLRTESKKGFLDDKVRGWLRYNGRRYWWDINNGNNSWDTDPNCFIAQYISHGVNGGHPVTEELKTFLMEYSLAERLFCDGNGWAESVGLKSNEESQWLFNCYYYAHS